MAIERYLNRLITAEIQRKNLNLARLDDALAKSIAALEGCPYELGHRVILNAVFSFQEGGSVLDMGGGLHMYHAILKNLGMDVTIADLYFEGPLKERFSNMGIKLAQGDLYNVDIPQSAYDVVSSFECLEHIPHSPKKIIDKIHGALKTGGSFVLSVPNVARFEQRWRVLIGRTPHEKYSFYYNSGDYFIGHHREMTVDEVRYMLKEGRFTDTKLFTTDMTVISAKKRSYLKTALNQLNYRYLLTDSIMPRNLRKHIWARAVKR